MPTPIRTHLPPQQHLGQMILTEHTIALVLLIPYPEQPRQIHQLREILPILQPQPRRILKYILTHQNRRRRQMLLQYLYRRLKRNPIPTQHLPSQPRQGGQVRHHRHRRKHVQVQNGLLVLIHKRDLRDCARIMIIAHGDTLDVDRIVLRIRRERQRKRRRNAVGGGGRHRVEKKTERRRLGGWVGGWMKEERREGPRSSRPSRPSRPLGSTAAVSEFDLETGSVPLPRRSYPCPFLVPTHATSWSRCPVVGLPVRPWWCRVG